VPQQTLATQAVSIDCCSLLDAGGMGWFFMNSVSPLMSQAYSFSHSYQLGTGLVKIIQPEEHISQPSASEKDILDKEFSNQVFVNSQCSKLSLN